jgi:hypothetical protein
VLFIEYTTVLAIYPKPCVMFGHRQQTPWYSTEKFR